MRIVFGIIILCSVCIGIASAQPGFTPPPPPPGGMIGKATPPRPLMFDQNEVKFGAQGLGVESCIYVTLMNASPASQVIRRMYILDTANYSLPSPTPQMMPVSLQPNHPLKFSVCFKPLKAGVHDSYLIVITPDDSLVLPIKAKGLKADDYAKLPKTGISIEAPSKKHKEWTFRLRLTAQAHITMQVYNELGMMVESLVMGELKPEGVYEQTFDGKDKGHLPLPAGKYYLRCVVDEVGRANPQVYSKAFDIK